jgi:uncharacterized membrane protein YphA (DoxX/SURF4 family)
MSLQKGKCPKFLQLYKHIWTEYQLVQFMLHKEYSELLFRLLFSAIFITLGFEHIFSDALIMTLMPEWVPFQGIISKVCGVWILFWGTHIALGYRLKAASLSLLFFLVIVTVTVHVPGIFFMPSSMPKNSSWMWDILQRSNLAKNICLIGVCLQLYHHTPGRWSIQSFRRLRQKN